MGDLFSSLGKLGSNVFDVFNARGREKQAKKEDEWRRKDLNFDPAYASEGAPKFQAATSPVARAYLESFLTGSNPDAVQGTRLGSGVDKSAADRRKRELFGTDASLLAAGKAERDPSRWAVKTPDRYAGETRADYARMGNDHTDELERLKNPKFV